MFSGKIPDFGCMHFAQEREVLFYEKFGGTGLAKSLLV